MQSASEREKRPSKGLAVASCVCGILSLPTSLFLIGLVFGLAGLVFGVAELWTARSGRVWAWVGLGLSGVGTVASLAILAIYGTFFQQAMTNVNRWESYEGWIGVQAPDFVTPDVTGSYLQLSDFRGKRVILDFHGAHCPACQKEVPFFIELRSRVSPNDLAIIGISSADPGEVRSFIEENHINYPFVGVRDLPAPYRDVNVTPAAIIIDRQGTIQRILLGYTSFEELESYATEDNFARSAGNPPG